MKETKLTISNGKMRLNLPALEEVLAHGREVIPTGPTTPTTPNTPPKVVVYVAGQDQMALAKMGDLDFDGEREITRAGLPQITPHGNTVAEVLENFFYPALPPTALLIASDPQREHGSDGDTILYYNAFATTNALASLVVNGVSIDVDINQGSQNTATIQDTDKTFSMTVTDTAGLSTSATASVSYFHNRFWFASATDLLAASDADLSTLLHGVSTKEFATSRQQSRSFTLNNEYSYFAYLDSYGDASFTVGGLPNTAYQERVFQYENPNGYVATFRLYRSGGKGTGSIGVVLN